MSENGLELTCLPQSALLLYKLDEPLHLMIMVAYNHKCCIPLHTLTKQDVARKRLGPCLGGPLVGDASQHLLCRSIIACICQAALEEVVTNIVLRHL